MKTNNRDHRRGAAMLGKQSSAEGHSNVAGDKEDQCARL
jgi:hypothetical protein